MYEASLAGVVEYDVFFEYSASESTSMGVGVGGKGFRIVFTRVEFGSCAKTRVRATKQAYSNNLTFKCRKSAARNLFPHHPYGCFVSMPVCVCQHTAYTKLRGSAPEDLFFFSSSLIRCTSWIMRQSLHVIHGSHAEVVPGHPSATLF